MKKQVLTTLFALAGLAAQAQNVNIPDVNFKAYLVGNTAINTNGDANIQVSEATAFTGKIDCSVKSIVNLQGIEAFVKLTTLWCSYNQLMTLDVSKNIALTDLSCHNNKLTALDVSKNTVLTYFDCSRNNLTALDVSKNTALPYLDCNYNNLTALDVSKNTALINLICYGNNLTTLDVSKNTALVYLECYSNQLTVLDVSKNTALTYLQCSDNKLTALDVSKNTALTILEPYSNQLTLLDVSKNTALTYLQCHSNQLTALDVSKNTALTNLDCYGNQLTALNMKNGQNTKIINFSAKVNPKLFCIQVDDAAKATASWATNVDVTASFNVQCGTCSFAVQTAAQTVAAAAGGGSVALTVSDVSCAWSAVSSCSYVTVINTSGTGSAAVSYTVAANTGSSARTCAITIAGKNVVITQSGTTGIIAISRENGFNVWPNPNNTGLLHIESSEMIENVEVYDILGARSHTPNFPKREGVSLDLSGLTKGIYTLRICTKENSVVRKVVVE